MAKSHGGKMCVCVLLLLENKKNKNKKNASWPDSSDRITSYKMEIKCM
jgi:hypothetical protein